MKRRSAMLVLLCVSQAMLFSGLAWALGAEFSDGFDASDETRWSKEGR